MSVAEIAICDVEDPNGTPLVTLTDTDLVDWWFRAGIGPAELGAGRFVVRKDNANGQAFNLKGEAHLAKITIPVIDPDPLFAWWVGRGEYKLFEAKGQSGAELLTFSGPGVMDIMRQSVLDFEAHAGGFGTGAGPRPAHGYWIFNDWTPGRIARRMIEEDQASPRSALPDVTHDFNATDDSDSVPWADSMDEDFRPRIKTDFLTVLRVMSQAADFETWMTPDLLLQAFNELGSDLTSATFAAGKVRFVKGVNILTRLGRTRFSREKATHALVEGADQVYHWAVQNGWTPPEPIRQIGLDYPDSARTGVLDRAGHKEFQRRTRAQDAIGFEVLPGDDELEGLYLPFVHYRPGSLITLRTGASGREYVNSPQRLTAIEISKAAAVSDANDDKRLRSIKVTIELNATRAITSDGRPAGVARTIAAPHSHPSHLCGTDDISDVETGTTWKLASSTSDFAAPAGWHTAAFSESGYASATVVGDAAWVDDGSSRWVWASSGTQTHVWLRELVTLDSLPISASLLWASDASFDVYVNGTLVANDLAAGLGAGGYTATHTTPLPVTDFVEGVNVIAIYAQDPGGAPHGVYGVFSFVGEGGSVISGTSASGARCDHKHLAEELLTRELDTELHLAPDGSGGVQWVAMAGGLVAWVNVQDYGAIEDNATDALAAFNAARDALVAVGGGRFYMPGTGVGYLLSGGVDALTVPGIVMGDGVAATVIHCSSSTAHLFTSASATRAPVFQDFSVVNDAATPTAGSAIRCSTGGNSALYRNLRIENFWVGIRHEDGAAWASEYVTMNGIKKYGYHISNESNPDEGDWRILFSTLSTGASDTPDAGIRIDSSGGGQIIGLKVVSPSPNTGYLHGIDLAIAGSDVTSILKVISPSVENIRGDAIHLTQTGTASYSQVSIIDLQTSLPENNTGKAISAVAEDAGGIASITVVGGIFATNGTARSAMQFTNIDTVTIVVPQLIDNFTSSYTESGSTSITEVGGGASVLDDLSDVAITSPAENDTLRYIGGEWVNDIRRWEPVTFNFGTGPELVWDGDDLAMEWKAY